jgi:hypothetical protein
MLGVCFVIYRCRRSVSFMHGSISIPNILATAREATVRYATRADERSLL